MATEKSKFSIKSNGNSLGVTKTAWKKALENAHLDPSVHIRHAVIDGDEKYRKHVASIPERVGCHFHAQGDEDYAVVSGKGTLHWGEVEKTDQGYRVKWETPVDVNTGDNFVIPEGYAHQLEKRDTEDLIIIFGCPDTHLNDMADRTVLPDSPMLKSL